MQKGRLNVTLIILKKDNISKLSFILNLIIYLCNYF